VIGGTVQIFIFAVAIAVGLTPELLPLIVTSNLAKGAIEMSRWCHRQEAGGDP